jgi:linearmycin/streptolysin S transport system permease protein
MIPTLMRVAWISLRRDRVAQTLTFILPITFFTIFASEFGSQGMRGASRVDVAVVDEDRSEYSRRLVETLRQDGGLDVRTTVGGRGADQATPLDRAKAEALVRGGDRSAAIVIPKGARPSFGAPTGAPPIDVLADPSNPVASQIVAGLLQKAAMTAAPELTFRSDIDQFEKYAGPLTPQQRTAVDTWEQELQRRSAAPQVKTSTTDLGGAISVHVIDVLGKRRDNPLIAFYAAGIAIMFLLFTCSGAAGTLLDEVDSGTLDRVLTSRAGMTGLLAAKWSYLTLLGVLQITVMFTYGALVFRLPFLRHLAGFAVMTPVSAAAVAGFGLLLATACRTRAQLSGLSTIVILTISALGGSMFPRFLMSPAMQKMGLVTFNTWALDGYLKVFWREARIVELWPQVLVLAAFTTVFLVTARWLARRWEAA